MKRSFDSVTNYTRSKRPKLSVGLDIKRYKKELVSATHLYNYMRKDTLVDWLKLTSRRGTRSTPAYTKAGGFTEFIMNKGVEFEDKLIKYINDDRISVVTVSKYINDNSLRKTKELMKQGIPVLHSVPVRNPVNGTQGIIDLLVRSDYIHRLIDENPLTETEQCISSPKLGHSYHYVVIDIKFSTLPLRADSVHLLNSGNYPAYKAQCLIYTKAVGIIQGYTAPYAFVMGRRWSCTQEGVVDRNYTCLNRLGKISYDTVDFRYNYLVDEAIKWVRDVKKNGSKWTINPPSRMELYPNMCVDSGVWNTEKEKIADSIGELTNIWYVGVKHRNEALLKGVKSWRDKRCNAKTMNMSGVRAPTINAIISINQQTEDKIRPKVIQNNLYDWKNSGNELFVDFETLSDCFSDFNNLPEQACADMIFMIGVGFEENGKWVYKNFTCKDQTYTEEYRIMNEFAQFVSDRGNPQLFYWHADSRFWNSAECRQFDIAESEGDDERKDHISDNWKVHDWADMYKIFQSEPIVINGCFKFGLKAIAKAMRKHKMITASIESDCSNGMSAMIKALKCYNSSKHPERTSDMKDIAKYNEFDVKVLWEILTYLRNNHSE